MGLVHDKKRHVTLSAVEMQKKLNIIWSLAALRPTLYYEFKF